MKVKRIDVILTTALLAVVVTGFAHTWQPTTASVDVGALSMSADGKIICAVPSADRPVISVDSGKTWSIATSSPAYGAPEQGAVALSADGSKIFAAISSNGFSQTLIFRSQDQGTNWTQTAFPGTATFTKYIVACSADGTKVVTALKLGSIFYSTNSGASCYTSSVPAAAWQSIASSADGGRMVAAARSGAIYFSEDFGATWTPTSLPSQSWEAVCTSSDGKTIGAIAGSIYISTNAGVTWSTTAIGGVSIACSADGGTWIAAGSHIYTSTNSGATWQSNLSSAPWMAGVVSADGAEMVAFGLSQGTWLGRASSSPQLNIQPQNSAFVVSWLVPSTNFVLQENTDLTTTNWMAVPNSSALNFTNLQLEVPVPASTSSAFFRLMAQ